MNKRENSINVRMTDGELAMVEALSKKYGGISFSDVIRRVVEERFSKAFPMYTRKNETAGVGVPPVELTKEQICEMKGGRIEKNGSGLVCVFQKSRGMNLTVPLSMMGEGEYKL